MSRLLGGFAQCGAKWPALVRGAVFIWFEVPVAFAKDDQEEDAKLTSRERRAQGEAPAGRTIPSP
jgi:hypothetical protein